MIRMIDMLVRSAPTWLWLAALIVFIIAEAMTAQVVCIWFVAGALVSLLLSMFKVKFGIQLAAFIVVSLAMLLSIRPLVKRKLEPKHVATNADRVIDAVAVVTLGAEAGYNARVFVDGQDWSAICSQNLIQGDKVKVLEITGVTLRVEKL